MSELDRWLSAGIRAEIEQRYYERVNEQAAFEQLWRDPDFMREPDRHVGLFSDHGTVHVRDVAAQILTVLRVSHGVLLPRRPELPFARLCGYGVLVAYFHDIGMVDFSAAGRAMHPEFAAQALFDPALDGLLDRIWQEDSGDLASHLTGLAAQGVLPLDPRSVLRELLALSMAHSKGKVPVAVLNDPAQLRRVVQRAVSTDLRYLYLLQRVTEIRTSPPPPDAARREQQLQLAAAEAALADYAGPRAHPHAGRLYADFERESFAWLVASHPALRALVQEVTDALRALRAADALRQRGTTLKTSGNYEVSVDHRSGNAVIALRHGDSKLFLLETADPKSAGEANVAASELDSQGNLRVTFHRGAFTAPGAMERAARASALVVYDMQRDAIESFVRPPGQADALGLKAAETVCLALEETEDDPGFVRLVQREVQRLDAAVGARIDIVPSLEDGEAHERERYLSGRRADWSLEQRHELLSRMRETGHRIDGFDLHQAFEHVNVIRVEAGDTLIEAGAPSSFVYIPLGPGLRVVPLGGYDAFAVQPWMPLGITGVIRGAARNGDVIADRELDLLMLPKNVYLRCWHKTYDPASFRRAVYQLLPDEPLPRTPDSESRADPGTDHGEDADDA